MIKTSYYAAIIIEIIQSHLPHIEDELGDNAEDLTISCDFTDSAIFCSLNAGSDDALMAAISHTFSLTTLLSLEHFTMSDVFSEATSSHTNSASMLSSGDTVRVGIGREEDN